MEAYAIFFLFSITAKFALVILSTVQIMWSISSNQDMLSRQTLLYAFTCMSVLKKSDDLSLTGFGTMEKSVHVHLSLIWGYNYTFLKGQNVESIGPLTWEWPQYPYGISRVISQWSQKRFLSRAVHAFWNLRYIDVGKCAICLDVCLIHSRHA